jgi:hypothetical protein
MLTLNSPTPPSFAYRRTKPFTKAEFKFKTALGAHAAERLLPKLQTRTAGRPEANQYTGINARVGDHAVYLEAIITNNTEWGGFGFDFARLVPSNGGLYNLSLRKLEDWTRAECSTVAAASNYFFAGSIYPRASDWILIARGKTFEHCVDLIEQHPSI